MFNYSIVVLNKETGDLVPYRVGKDEDIVIVSTDPKDTDDSCYVTTWDEITSKNLRGKGVFIDG